MRKTHSVHYTFEGKEVFFAGQPFRFYAPTCAVTAEPGIALDAYVERADHPYKEEETEDRKYVTMPAITRHGRTVYLTEVGWWGALCTCARCDAAAARFEGLRAHCS